MYEGELMQAGIGQGYDSVTPLQLLNAYCALANGGNLWQPQVVKSITRRDGTTVPRMSSPCFSHKLPASAETLEVMRVAMRQVVTSRHTYNLVDLPITVAGKTGTAEFGVPDRYGRLPYHEWFVGYVPADPQARRLLEARFPARGPGLHLRRQHVGQRGDRGRQVLPDAALRPDPACKTSRLRLPHPGLHPALGHEDDQLLRRSGQGLTERCDR